MTLRSALPALLVLALIVLFYGGLKLGDPGRLDSPFIGKPAPRFDMPDLFDSRARVSIDRFAGQPFVLNVWGTWCPECYREHDTLLRIAEQGLVPLVGLNWRDERAKAVAYLQQAGNPFAQVGSDPDGRNAIDWGVYGAPETFLIDASGTVIHKHIGALDWATWQNDFLARLPAAAGTQVRGATP
ncbi:MAG: DsbE family thiol:disulfide interchange protein [Gammaproteobacteria bacterium]